MSTGLGSGAFAFTWLAGFTPGMLLRSLIPASRSLIFSFFATNWRNGAEVIHRWAAGFPQMGTRPRHDFLPPPCLLPHLCKSVSSVDKNPLSHSGPESSDTEDATEDGKRVRHARRAVSVVDGSRHPLWEEADEGGESEEVSFPFHFSKLKVDGVTHRLEGEEGDSNRQNIARAERHERRRGREPSGGVDPSQ